MCGWNPVMLVDPDGREIEDPSTPEGKALWAEFQNIIASRVAAYDAKTNSLRSNGSSFSNWRANRRDNARGSNPFIQAQNEIHDLEQSTNVYRINYSDLGPNKGGSLSYGENGVINININSSKHGDFSAIQRIAHEFKHAHQFEIGQLDLNINGLSGMLYDKTDEFAAYSRQNAFYGMGSYGKGRLLNNVIDFVNTAANYKNRPSTNRHIGNTGLIGIEYDQWRSSVVNGTGPYRISNRAKSGMQ